MIAFPNAKINIGLHVLEKRIDGFHNIETVFYPVSWCDVLEIIIDEKVALRKKNPDVVFKTTGLQTYSQMEKNLCVRAYRLLKNDFPLKPIRIHLHKIIPIGAGLGGGSSDAAFTIKLLDKIFSLGLTVRQMMQYAGALGSDCAFFIENKPAYAIQRGDLLEHMKLNMAGYNIAIVKPGAHISTAHAYDLVTPALPPKPLHALLKTPVEEWKQVIKNDFEDPVFKDHPELRVIKQKLYDNGAVYASMSGSGSSIYGIFKERKDFEKLFRGLSVWHGFF